MNNLAVNITKMASHKRTKNQQVLMGEILQEDMLLLGYVCRYQPFLMKFKNSISHLKGLNGKTGDVKNRGLCVGYRRKPERIKRDDDSSEQFLLRYSLSENVKSIYKLLEELETAQGERATEIQSVVSAFIVSVLWLGEVDEVVFAYCGEVIKAMKKLRLSAGRKLKENGVWYKNCGLDYLLNPQTFEPSINQKMDLDFSEIYTLTGLTNFSEQNEIKALFLMQESYLSLTEKRKEILNSIRDFIYLEINKKYYHTIEKTSLTTDDMANQVFAHLGKNLKRFNNDNKLTTFVTMEMNSLNSQSVNSQSIINLPPKYTNNRKKVFEIVSRFQDKGMGLPKAVALGLDEIRNINVGFKEIQQSEVLNLIQFKTVRENYEDQFDTFVDSSEEKELSELEITVQQLLRSEKNLLVRHYMATELGKVMSNVESDILSDEVLKRSSIIEKQKAREFAKNKIYREFNDPCDRNNNEKTKPTRAIREIQEMIDQQLNPVMIHFIGKRLLAKGFCEYGMYVNEDIVPSYYSKSEIKEKLKRADKIINAILKDI